MNVHKVPRKPRQTVAREAEKKLADVAAANEQLNRDAACNDMVLTEFCADHGRNSDPMLKRLQRRKRYISSSETPALANPYKENLKIAHEEIHRVRAELEVARALDIQAEDLEKSSNELKYKQKELARAHAVFTERTKKIESDTSELWGHVNRLQADLRRTEEELFNVFSAAEVAEEARKILARELAETKESLKIAQGVHERSRAEREVAKGFDIQARGLDDTTNVEEIFSDPGLYTLSPSTWDNTVQMATAASTLARPSSALRPASFEPQSFGAAAGPASTSFLKNARTWETDGPPPSDPNMAQSPFIMVTDPYRPTKRPRLSSQDNLPAKCIQIRGSRAKESASANVFRAAISFCPNGFSLSAVACGYSPATGRFQFLVALLHPSWSLCIRQMAIPQRGEVAAHVVYTDLPLTSLAEGEKYRTSESPSKTGSNPMCLGCLQRQGRCRPPGQKAPHRAKTKIEDYQWDSASLAALATFHNAVVKAGAQPGNWMGDGQPAFYMPPL
ncbi:hypothetical protein FB45DRAFT_863398 [Roridomyces roridus]|uniref:Uncharacterized protein n=1 Tax=Roridomyces roridus TaxID=1738132 RepID=A0AAD7FR35_9AGAR|nr:hypothetical protein FB45DRAFT_863398 [Roridomyces roridus]